MGSRKLAILPTKGGDSDSFIFNDIYIESRLGNMTWVLFVMTAR